MPVAQKWAMEVKAAGRGFGRTLCVPIKFVGKRMCVGVGTNRLVLKAPAVRCLTGELCSQAQYSSMAERCRLRFQAGASIARLAMLLVWFGIFRGCTGVTDATEASVKGVLKGQVTFVGAECNAAAPNFKVPPCEGPYPRYEVVVFDKTGRSVVAKTSSVQDGRYSIELRPGDYLVYRPSGIDRRETLRVTVAAGKATALDLRIDTGVR